MLPRRWTMFVALGIALASLLIITVSLAASGTSPTIYAYLNSDFVYGYTSSGGVPVTVTLANASGIKAQIVVTSSVAVSTTGLYASSLPTTIQVNDVLTVTSPVDSPILMAVPNITARANRSTNTLTGTAPANSPLRVTLEQPGVTYEQFVTSTAGGDYSATFAQAIQAGDWGTITLTPTVAPTNTVTHLLYRTPQLRFYLGSDQLDGYTVGGDLPMTLALSNGVLLSTTSSHNSFSYGKFALNTPNNLQAGTRVTMTAGTEAPLVATIQALTVNMDAVHNALSGTGPGPNAAVYLEFNAGAQTYTATVLASAAAPYTYSVPFTTTMMPGDWARAYVADLNGNLTYAYARLPVVYVYEGNRHIFGYAAAPNLPVTITLKNGATVVATAGSLVSSQNVYAWGFFSTDLRDGITDAPIKIQPGYTVVVTSGASSVMTVPVVSLNGQVDPINDVVTGSTSPNSNLQVTLYRWNGSDFSGDFTQNGAADASGNYTVSFTSVYSAQLGDYALVYRPDGVTGVVYVLAPSTHPTLSVINPMNVPANTYIPITSTIGGGVHVTYANVHWDTASRSVSYTYHHSTPIQSGGIGNYTSIIAGVQLGQVFFRARAFVDGQELWSEPERSVQVGRAVYLPLILR